MNGLTVSQRSEIHIHKDRLLIHDFINLFQDTYTKRVVLEMAALLRSIFPGLVVGLIASSMLVAWRPIRRIQSLTQAKGFSAVLLLAFAGVVSPFCTYLAIPIAAALLVEGVAPGPVFAFMCATPLMNPTLFTMTWSVFGLPMALARAFAAFGFGVLGGAFAHWTANRYPQFFLRIKEIPLIPTKEDESEKSFYRRWIESFIHLGKFVVKYVLLGIFIAAIVKEVVPMNWVISTVGRERGYGVLAGSLLGIPLYACGGGTIPLIQILMNLGMSPGAALAFFLAGPATKVPTLAAMQMTMGHRITSAYILLAILWAILAGTIFQILG